MKIKSIIIVSTLLFCFSLIKANDISDTAIADTNKWKFGGTGTNTFSQSYYEFWSAGGQNALALNTLLNLFLDYSNNLTEWENNLDVAYGFSYQDFDDDGKKEDRKIDDRLGFSSKLGRKSGVNSKLFYTGLVNFRTQMARGYKYEDEGKNFVSEFMSPAYLNLSTGIDYKPNKKISIYLAPFSGKFTFVTNDSLIKRGAFGVEPGRNHKSELGGFFKGAYKDEVIKNVDLSTKLELFASYLEDPAAIDVNWEVLITMKINEYLSANINTVLVYDEDIDAINSDDGVHNPRVQFKEVFGVGLSFKF
jgi:hypothetical protein